MIDLTNLTKPWRVAFWRDGIFCGMIGGPALHLSDKADAETVAGRYLTKARKEGKAGDYRAVRVDASGRIVEVA